MAKLIISRCWDIGHSVLNVTESFDYIDRLFGFAISLKCILSGILDFSCPTGKLFLQEPYVGCCCPTGKLFFARVICDNCLSDSLLCCAHVAEKLGVTPLGPSIFLHHPVLPVMSGPFVGSCETSGRPSPGCLSSERRRWSPNDLDRALNPNKQTETNKGVAAIRYHVVIDAGTPPGHCGLPAQTIDSARAYVVLSMHIRLIERTSGVCLRSTRFRRLRLSLSYCS